MLDGLLAAGSARVSLWQGHSRMRQHTYLGYLLLKRQVVPLIAVQRVVNSCRGEHIHGIGPEY